MLINFNFLYYRKAPSRPRSSCEETWLLSEISTLQSINGDSEALIESNKLALGALALATAEGREAVKRLEYDVNVVEKEGRRLGRERDKVMAIRIPGVDYAEGEDEEGDSTVIYAELKALQEQARTFREQHQHQQQSESPEAAPVAPTPPISEMAPATPRRRALPTTPPPRAPANDSPSSSGASSGGEDPGGCAGPAAATSASVASPSTTATDEGGDASDTGLSSLHSSSDEAAVATSTKTATTKQGNLEAIGLNFGTLV